MFKNFGEKLRLFRETTGDRQIQFAERLGISQGALSNIENGKVPPNLELLEKLCDEFDTTIDFWQDNLLKFKKRSDSKIKVSSACAHIIKCMQEIAHERKLKPVALSARTRISEKRLGSFFDGTEAPTIEESIKFISAFPEFNSSWFFLNKGPAKRSIEILQVEQLAQESKEALQWITSVAEKTAKLAAEKS